MIPWCPGGSLFFKMTSPRVISDFPALKAYLEQTKAPNWSKETLLKRQELRDAGVRQSQLESKYSLIPGAFLASMLTFCLSSFQHHSDMH